MEQRASQTRPCVQLVRAYDADTWCTGIEQSIYSHPGISRRCVLSHSVPHFDTYRLPFKILPATLPVWDFRVAPMGGRLAVIRASAPSFSPSTTRNCCWPSQGFAFRLVQPKLVEIVSYVRDKWHVRLFSLRFSPVFANLNAGCNEGHSLLYPR